MSVKRTEQLPLSPIEQAIFWSRVDTSKRTGCWPWRGAKHERGYGRFFKDGAPYRAPRIAWEIINGEPMGERFACHHCDNPECCNPAHIFPGTPKENIHDAMRKGRFGRKPGTENDEFEV